MRKQNLLFLVLFLFIINNISAVVQQYAWQQLADFGGVSRAGAYGFSIGNYGYMGGGGYASTSLNDFWQYDPSTNSWTQKSDVPVSVRAASTFVINGKGYLTGGEFAVGPFNAALYMYDPVANSWTAKASFPGTARYGAGAFSIGTKGYFGVGDGGTASGPYYADFYEYDAIADTWTQKATFPGTPRYGTFGISLNGEGYYGFGGNYAIGTNFGDWYQYDPVANSWTQKATFPGTPRSYVGGFVIDSLIYVGTGVTSNPTEDFYEYNPTTDTWTQEQDYGGGNRWAVANFSIGNIGYFGTGYDAATNPHNEFWEYAPSVPPAASFQASDSSICTNTCINFTDLSTNATSWLWVFAGASPVVSTNQNPQQVCYANSGDYDVTLIVGSSFGSDTLTLSKYITVNPSPPTPVITESHDTLYCSTDPTYVSFQWYYSSVPIQGATDTSLIAYYSGNYNVKVTNANGCSISAGTILGVPNYADNNLISLSPNPATNQITIHFSSVQSGEAMVSVINVLGQEVLPPATIHTGRGNDAIINIDKLPSGTYFLQIKTDNGGTVKRFVKG